MADERLHQMLLPLDGAATPDESFGDALFERIAPLALAAGRRDRTWHGRIVMAVRSVSLPIGGETPVQLRTAILLATLLGLLLALAAIIGSRAHDPNQVVLGSEAVYRDPPAFDMTVGYSDGGIRRFRYDGGSAMRLDVVKGAFGLRPEGTYFLVDTERGRMIEWDPVGRTSMSSALEAGLRPIFQLDMRFGAEVSRANQFASQCLKWQYVEETTVVARAAHHVRCATGLHEEFWVDAATGFVLRSTAVPTDDARIFLTGEVRSLQLDVAIDPAAFAADEGPRLGAPMPGGEAPFEAGVRVVSNRFSPPFAATPGEDWRSWGTDTDVVGFVRGADGGGVWVINLKVVTDVATGRDVPLDPGVDAAVDWLRHHPYVETGEPMPTRVGLREATSMTYRDVLPRGFESTCPHALDSEPAPACRRFFRAGTGYWTFGESPPAEQRASFLDVNGATIMILSSADGPDRAAQGAANEALLASIEFLD